MVSTKETQREKRTTKIMTLSTTRWDHMLSRKIQKQSYQALTGSYQHNEGWHNEGRHNLWLLWDTERV
jgi:hypothetical protein